MGSAYMPPVIGGTGLLYATYVSVGASALAAFSLAAPLAVPYTISLVAVAAITALEQRLLQSLIGGHVSTIMYSYNAQTGVSRLTRRAAGIAPSTRRMWDMPSASAQMLAFASAFWTAYLGDESNAVDEDDPPPVWHAQALWAVLALVCIYAVTSHLVTLEQVTLGIAGGALLGAQLYNVAQSVKS